MSEQGNMPNTWNSANYGFEIKSNELNCSSPQIPSYFFNPTWDNSMDHNDPFESALSSMVSSPTIGIPTCGNVDGDGKTIVLSELIGKLGGISNNIGDISSHSSCYSTPLNSPPKLGSLSMVDNQIRGNFPIPSSHQISVPFSPDLGFAERAARFSSFGSNFNGNRPFGLTPKLEPISQSGKIGGSQFGGKERSSSQDKKSVPEIAEFVDSREGSSVSYQISGGESANARKRKSAPKGKSKDNNHNPSPSSAPSKDAKV
ncbi:transcription factor bHLH78-like [Impatiens glandulifera]|uniref:transcription factor bHLH78-like n=1 Tax=Impatiens glandulifera TaxID=253017 RepID=UPI001FB15399|nr:transcription factor bHLH78-like [Impatiens glandulifera]